MSSNNTIHKIFFTPRRYVLPPSQAKKYLLAEDGSFIVTEDGKKIKL